MTHKLKLITAALCCVASIMQAQPVYQKNDNLIGLGFGVGGAYNLDRTDYDTPLFNASYERGVWSAGWDQVQGIVSLGLLVGYKQSGKTDEFLTNYYSTTKYQYRVIGLRSSFHLQNYFGRELKKWDLYAGIMLGTYFERETITYNYPAYFNPAPSETVSRNAQFSGYLGARYFFKEHWAICAETGFGYTNFLIGAAYKF